MRRMNALIRWTPSIVWMAVIFFMSAQTGERLDSLLPLFQRFLPMESFDWGHFVAYFVLACTYYWALLGRNHRLYKKLLVLLMCGLYGVTDEFHQSFVGGRQPDPLDMRNDVIGAALAMLFVSFPPVHRFLRAIAAKLVG
jgi:hypothetical protein